MSSTLTLTESYRNPQISGSISAFDPQPHEPVSLRRNICRDDAEVTSQYASVDAAEQRFEAYAAQLDAIGSTPELWPEGSEAPSASSIALAQSILLHLAKSDLMPDRVTASADGGAAICFVRGDLYCDLECLNTGTILGVTTDRQSRPAVWDVEPSARGIEQGVSRIRRFLQEEASTADASAREAS